MKHIKTFESLSDGSEISHRSRENAVLQPIRIEDIVKDGTVEDLSDWLKGEKGHPNERDRDINFESGLIIRAALKNDRYDMADYFIKNGGDIKLRRNMVTKWAAERGNMEALEFLYKNGLRLTERELSDVKNWLNTSDKISNEEKEPIFEYIEKFID